MFNNTIQQSCTIDITSYTLHHTYYIIRCIHTLLHTYNAQLNYIIPHSSSVTHPIYPPMYPPPLPADGTGVYPPYVYGPTTNESSSIVQQHSGAASNFVAPSFLPPSAMLGAASSTVSPPGMQQVTI